MTTDATTDSTTDAEPEFHAFRKVPRTGVIYVTSEAARLGFGNDKNDWCNLGQGMPEIGELDGAPKRVVDFRIEEEDQEYAPVAGLWELREAVADLYNQLFRRGFGSKYSAENVAICGGGRTSLARLAAGLGRVNLGHFLPDYTAYEELLDVFRSFSPIPILLDPAERYEFSVAALRREITGRGLAAVLLSNPCNPTGKLVGGKELAQWVDLARELSCTLLLDEFYSHYIWRDDLALPDSIASAAQYVEDVDRDPIVLFDGLTKNWRYPGWRVTWTIGPKSIIESVTSAGSFLDGGGSRPMQRAAIPLLDIEQTRAETAALRKAFRVKRDFLLGELETLGVRVDSAPEGTFYIWGDVSQLPTTISDGMSFFRAALQEKVITVPGEFFDVDPGQRRAPRASRFGRHVRFSFGPPAESLRTAVTRLKKMVATCS